MGGIQSFPIAPLQSPHMVPLCYDTPSQGRSAVKKALLIGIGYRKPGGEWDSVATSIPNVTKFAKFLQG